MLRPFTLPGFLFVLIIPMSAYAQADGLIAYVPERPIERTADNVRIGFAPSAVEGKMEAVIPENAQRVDLLNGRGAVKRSYSAAELGDLSLDDLRPGTWTLRVHAAGTMVVRRFVVMHRGAIVWSPSGPVRGKRQR